MRALALLALVTLVACGDGLPPPPLGGGPPPGNITVGGPDAGDGGDGGDGGDAGDAGDGGAMDTVSCITATPPDNVLNLAGDNTFTPTTAYTSWIPDACAANRQLLIGLTDAGCNLSGGNRFQLSMRGAQITSGAIPQGVALQVATTPVGIEAVLDAGVWENCPGSSGTITFTSLTQAAGESTVVTIGAGTVLTTCSGPALTPLTVSGKITAIVADDCEDA